MSWSLHSFLKSGWVDILFICLNLLLLGVPALLPPSFPFYWERANGPCGCFNYPYGMAFDFVWHPATDRLLHHLILIIPALSALHLPMLFAHCKLN